jgi:hypothetical protein
MIVAFIPDLAGISHMLSPTFFLDYEWLEKRHIVKSMIRFFLRPPTSGDGISYMYEAHQPIGDGCQNAQNVFPILHPDGILRDLESHAT